MTTNQKESAFNIQSRALDAGSRDSGVRCPVGLAGVADAETLTLTNGSAVFTDDTATNFNHRFYRVRVPEVGKVLPGTKTTRRSHNQRSADSLVSAKVPIQQEQADKAVRAPETN